MSQVKSRATKKESNPWAGLEAALAASATSRDEPPPGYWNVRDLCKKIGRSRAVASNKILLMREAGLLDVWEGSTPTAGACDATSSRAEVRCERG